MSLDELRVWAKTTQFPDPIRWGEVEARIRAEPGPTTEELEEAARHAPTRGIAINVFRGLVLAPFVLFTFGISVVALAFVVAYVVFDKSLSSDWEILPKLAFGFSLLLVLFSVYTWSESRRREFSNLGVTGLTAVASAASFALLTTSDELLSGVWTFAYWMSLVTAVVSILLFIFFLVVAKPTPGETISERRRVISPEERWLRSRRAIVLEQLGRRGLITDADSSAVMALPPDTWRQLESLPDGRVVRRR